MNFLVVTVVEPRRVARSCKSCIRTIRPGQSSCSLRHDQPATSIVQKGGGKCTGESAFFFFLPWKCI